jgi:hypothetical protein
LPNTEQFALAEIRCLFSIDEDLSFIGLRVHQQPGIVDFPEPLAPR